jgi:hypothetical protein
VARRGQPRGRLGLAAGITGEERQAKLYRRSRTQEEGLAVVLGGLEVARAGAGTVTSSAPTGGLLSRLRSDGRVAPGTGGAVPGRGYSRERARRSA